MRCEHFWSHLSNCPDGKWHSKLAGLELRGSDIPGQLRWLDCQRRGTTGAPTASWQESRIVFVIFVTTANHGNGTCEMTGIALISVSSCWGYWESIFCFGNIMFGFPKQNFEGFLFMKTLSVGLPPNSSFFSSFKTQKARNKNSDFQMALLMLQLEDYFSFFPTCY